MDIIIQQYDFVAPFVPAADAIDGLLQAAELDNDLAVNIQIWDGARTGYTTQLLWDNELVGDVRAIKQTEKPGDTLTLLLPPEYLKTEGVHHLAFRAINPIAETSNDSPTVTILVDRTALGIILLAPVILRELTPGGSVIGIIPGYSGMAIGDVIQTFCNDIEGPRVTLHPDNLTTTPATLLFQRSFLESLNSNDVVIGYRVINQAGNISIMSRLSNLTLQE